MTKKTIGNVTKEEIELLVAAIKQSDAFVCNLLTKDEVKTLKMMVSEYKKSGGVGTDLNYKIRGECKPVTYLFESVLDQHFAEVCREIGIPKRKGAHIAIRDFIERHKE